MHFLFAPDSFKGSLTSTEIIAGLTRAAQRVFPDVSVTALPLADGGDGTVESVLACIEHAEERKVRVCGPLRISVEASYCVINDSTVLIEMAQASGIALIEPDERNPLAATTFGTGELIRHALDDGFRDFRLAIGGSATNDGGMGALEALGARFIDSEGNSLSGCGASLAKVSSIDISGLHPAICESRFEVLCDVTNPLCGPNGATYIYGPQKGVTQEMLSVLDEGMRNYANAIEDCLGVDILDAPGAGAAGGLGAAAMAFFNARSVSGAEAIFALVGLDEILNQVSLVITGEGKIDGQSVHFGKLPAALAAHAAKKGIPVALICGGIGDDAQEIWANAEASIMSILPYPMSLRDAMDKADVLLENAAERMFRFIRIGQKLGHNH